jgi:putative transposase
MELLFQAKRRYRLSILNFIVTSNHIHLVVASPKNRESIPKAMQLVAGRTAQEYNRRKGRKGAFWQDRYHATAIETGKHLWRCLVYLDLNMVRAGVVKHPSEWKWSGYHEIQHPKKRYRLIDHETLQKLLHMDSQTALAATHRGWISSQLKRAPEREERYRKSIAIGSQSFVETVQAKMGIKAIGRRRRESRRDAYELRETVERYGRGNS